MHTGKYQKLAVMTDGSVKEVQLTQQERVKYNLQDRSPQQAQQQIGSNDLIMLVKDETRKESRLELLYNQPDDGASLNESKIFYNSISNIVDFTSPFRPSIYH